MFSFKDILLFQYLFTVDKMVISTGLLYLDTYLKSWAKNLELMKPAHHACKFQGIHT